MPYTLHSIDLSAGEQSRKEFLALNQNGRIPVIIDRDYNNFVVFLNPELSWCIWQRGQESLCQKIRKAKVLLCSGKCFRWGDGTHAGAGCCFERYFPEDAPAARTSYKNETRRLYEVLNNRLENVEFLAGDMSIADIATWAWVHTYRWSRIPVDGLEH